MEGRLFVSVSIRPTCEAPASLILAPDQPETSAQTQIAASPPTGHRQGNTPPPFVSRLYRRPLWFGRKRDLTIFRVIGGEKVRPDGNQQRSLIGTSIRLLQHQDAPPSSSTPPPSLN